MHAAALELLPSGWALQYTVTVSCFELGLQLQEACVVNVSADCEAALSWY